MASTYTTNTGIEKPGTGEKAGTWGTMTNTNMDLIDEAINGVKEVTLTAPGSSGSPRELSIVDGSASSGTAATTNGRHRYIEFKDGGDLGADAYVQLVPANAQKVLFCKNSLSASRSVFLFQGTYSASRDVQLLNGKDYIVKFDGAGTPVVSNILDNIVIGNDLTLGSDSSVLAFGADSEITVTHVADVGLNLKNTNTGDDKPFILKLQTAEAVITASEFLGKIQFQAPDTTITDDARLVAAQIAAYAESDFATDANATKLSFATGASEAATEKMSLNSTGVLTLNGSSGSLVIPNDGNIGSASDTDAIAISSAGTVTCSQSLVVNGSVDLGNATGDTITATGRFDSALNPSTNNARALGTSALRWSDLYVNDVYVGSSHDVNGILFVGTTTSVGGTSKCYFKFSGAGTRYGMSMRPNSAGHTYYIYLVNASNTFVGGISMDSDNSGVTFSQSSDYRLKENISDMTGAIDRVKALKPKRFNFKIDENKKIRDGFLAHEAQEVVPEAVTGEKDAMKDGEIAPQGIDQSKLVPLLTGALQEALAKIEVLEQKVAALEAK
tara:strand:+ start:809 stop:2479 length:1671 start_codon:yes stop_codon:yes gene_type:complete